jgi:predicted metal-binding membrane protein
VLGDSTRASALEHLLRRNRLIVATGLLVTTALAWRSLLRSAADMSAMQAMGMPAMRAWTLPDLAALLTMWSVMMVAMMLPSAAPVILLTVGTYRRRGGPDAKVATTLFVAGYLASWFAFSAVAALSQFGLHRAALLSPGMATTSVAVSGILLLAAGVYQFSPIKAACLSHCRSPIGHLAAEWREGFSGAFVMGARHGLFCVGCCWALMVLLFVAGVMNLFWVAAIAALVLVEKVAGAGLLVGRIAGALLAGWGAVLLVTGVG